MERPSMSRLQRSSVSFRRQGSSGRNWDDQLRGLDLKGLSTTPKAAVVHHDAFILAGDPSPRVVSRSLARNGGGAGAGAGAAAWASVIVEESPEVVESSTSLAAASAGGVIVEEGPEVEVVDSMSTAAASGVVVRADGDERQERPARRRISSAFCACMGHPPASHAQQ